MRTQLYAISEPLITQALALRHAAGAREEAIDDGDGQRRRKLAGRMRMPAARRKYRRSGHALSACISPHRIQLPRTAAMRIPPCFHYTTVADFKMPWLEDAASRHARAVCYEAIKIFDIHRRPRPLFTSRLASRLATSIALLHQAIRLLAAEQPLTAGADFRGPGSPLLHLIFGRLDTYDSRRTGYFAGVSRHAAMGQAVPMPNDSNLKSPIPAPQADDMPSPPRVGPHATPRRLRSKSRRSAGT